MDRVEHEGIVPEDKFIQVQELLAAKKDKPRRGAIAPTVAVGKTAEVLIGVGPAETIDTLSVRWPTGETQTFANPARRRYHHEPPGGIPGRSTDQFSDRFPVINDRDWASVEVFNHELG